MDRRQRKTREAIFNAFTELLSTKKFAQITVNEIIEKADIGRATFYAHFETKDFLLKELIEELFCHLFDSTHDNTEHRHIFSCNAPDSIFLHLLIHLKQNDNHILDLLSCSNNELFLDNFKENLKNLIISETELFENQKAQKLPRDFYINYVASTFVETVKWWIKSGLKETPQTIEDYFYLAI